MGYQPVHSIEGRTVKLLFGVHLVVQHVCHDVDGHVVVSRRTLVAVAFNRFTAARIAKAFTQPAVPEPASPPSGRPGMGA